MKKVSFESWNFKLRSIEILLKKTVLIAIWDKAMSDAEDGSDRDSVRFIWLCYTKKYNINTIYIKSSSGPSCSHVLQMRRKFEALSQQQNEPWRDRSACKFACFHQQHHTDATESDSPELEDNDENDDNHEEDAQCSQHSGR